MNKLSGETKRIFTLDYVLLSLILILYAISMFGIYMSGPLLDSNLNVYDLMFKQTTWLLLGFVLIYFIIKLGVDRLFTMVYVLYWILLVLMGILIIARYGEEYGLTIPLTLRVNGTWGWYDIVGIGSFQPSEFMKMALIIIFANIIYQHNIDKKSFSLKSDFQLIFKIGLYAIPALVLNILQPDTGIPIIIIVSLGVMFFMSGVRREWAIIIITLGIGALLGIVWLYYNDQNTLNSLFGGSASDYRLDRFYGWLDYEKFAQTKGYHLFTSLLSVGTAGWGGHPLHSLVMKIPEAQTDFIFAVLAQNTGLIGVTIIILLCFSLDIKLLLITMNSDLSRERYMIIGIVAMLCFQQFENIAMIFGLLPITGITLPFLSYGGSSYISYLIPMAVAFAMYSETKNAHRH